MSEELRLELYCCDSETVDPDLHGRVLMLACRSEEDLPGIVVVLPRL